MLKARPRSEREARTRLEARGFSTAEVDRALTLAKDGGLIDDRSFARLWVGERTANRPLSRQAVTRELLEKGVPNDIALAAVTDGYPDSLEKELLWRLARERYERLSGVDREKRERRTIGYLTRRGFSVSLVRSVVSRIADGGSDA